MLAVYTVAVLESNGNSKTRDLCCHMREYSAQLSNEYQKYFESQTKNGKDPFPFGLMSGGNEQEVRN